ncbi:dihydrolipoamide acetyltransferase family protein [Sphingomonas jaspsi]|uniref:dihydrolipoamide acetyltransferase family protein n=1 Tax=Sphingomonas jaspsi TaxID=392409 RepID=UPI0004BB18B9|nr:dihydrolipoamide acetyltransferase family protein [Sphingomonas jaspsi]
MALKAFTMPKWGIEMSEGMIGEWMVAEGEAFAKGDVLALIETDKITNEVEAEADGRFLRIVAAAGETHPVGALLAVLGEPGDEAGLDAFVGSFKAADTRFSTDDDDAPAPAPAPEPAPAPAYVIADTVAISPAARARAKEARLDLSSLSGSGRGGRIMLIDVDQALRPEARPNLKGPYPDTGGMAFASPMARRLAARHGVALEGLKGSGPRGRICKADVLAAAGVSATPPSGEVEIVAMTPMRKAIARRLTEAKQNIPHFYLRRRVRADRLMAAREKAGKVASVNDYLVRAVALALREVPAVNIQVHGTDIHRLPTADIAVAVATDKGLLTPVLRAAERLSLTEIAAATADLAARARASKLRQEEIDGGSFSLSNLGPYGVEQFDAIINPPQGAILAVGAARPEPIDEDGAIRIVPVLHLSLSCDHRAIDGADGARFLAALARLIEQPEAL